MGNCVRSLAVVWRCTRCFVTVSHNQSCEPYISSVDPLSFYKHNALAVMSREEAGAEGVGLTFSVVELVLGNIWAYS